MTKLRAVSKSHFNPQRLGFTLFGVGLVSLLLVGSEFAVAFALLSSVAIGLILVLNVPTTDEPSLPLRTLAKQVGVALVLLTVTLPFLAGWANFDGLLGDSRLATVIGYLIALIPVLLVLAAATVLVADIIGLLCRNHLELSFIAPVILILFFAWSLLLLGLKTDDARTQMKESVLGDELSLVLVQVLASLWIGAAATVAAKVQDVKKQTRKDFIAALLGISASTAIGLAAGCFAVARKSPSPVLECLLIASVASILISTLGVLVARKFRRKDLSFQLKF